MDVLSGEPDLLLRLAGAGVERLHRFSRQTLVVQALIMMTGRGATCGTHSSGASLGPAAKTLTTAATTARGALWGTERSRLCSKSVYGCPAP